MAAARFARRCRLDFNINFNPQRQDQNQRRRRGADVNRLDVLIAVTAFVTSMLASLTIVIAVTVR